MKAKNKTIYSPADQIILHRITPKANYNNIDTATYQRARKSKKDYLLISDGQSHLTNDPDRTADRHGYKNYEAFEIERLKDYEY
jgi:hypothetical protein